MTLNKAFCICIQQPSTSTASGTSAKKKVTVVSDADEPAKKRSRVPSPEPEESDLTLSARIKMSQTLLPNQALRGPTGMLLPEKVLTRYKYLSDALASNVANYLNGANDWMVIVAVWSKT